MEVTEEQTRALIHEIENLESRVRSKLKRLKDEMGLSKKYRFRIHSGRILLAEIQECIQDFRLGQMQKGLDGVWGLTQRNLKIKTINFPPNYKTSRQLRQESIRKNPEQLIKRSKSHGGGYRK